jgi:HK97 family phage prohead protease
MEIERRLVTNGSFRFQDGVQPKLTGYAALFDTFSQEIFGIKEKIARGAFAESIRKDDIRMLWNHDPNFVLARTTSGTLKLKEDHRGLWFEAIPPDTQWARDLLVSIKRGDVSQNSFGFQIEDQKWGRDKKVRTLKKVKLFDISPVTFPAYKDTEVFVRNGGNVHRLPLNRVQLSRRRLTTAEAWQRDMDGVLERMRLRLWHDETKRYFRGY